jgi:hypothetical protein
MTQTAEEKLVELAKAYARHRKALRDNSQAFRDLYDANPNYEFDLKSFRQEFVDDFTSNRDPQEVFKWHGWLHAVDTVTAWHDPVEGFDSAPIRQAARLMDERKEINAQGARIRKRLGIVGAQLLRADP